MGKMALLTLPLILMIAASHLDALTTVQFDAVKTFVHTDLYDGEGRPPTAILVRLGFHDCVGDNGCDGCINVENDSNRGLEIIVGRLDRLHAANTILTMSDGQTSTLSGLINRADLYALAATIATEEGMSEDTVMPFKFGRRTSDDCNSINNIFPNAHHGFTVTRDFLANAFTLDTREVVALMGAHSLGRTHTDNSGFNGPWTRNPNTLDNEYYQVLEGALNTRRTWTQRNVALAGEPERWQWGPPPPPSPAKRLLELLLKDLSKRQASGGGGGGGLMMLNADMCFIKDIEVRPSGQVKSPCTNLDDVNCLNTDESAEIVAEFVADNSQFETEFIAVYLKVLEKVPGGVNLSPPENVAGGGTGGGAGGGTGGGTGGGAGSGTGGGTGGGAGGPQKKSQFDDLTIRELKEILEKFKEK